MTCGASPYTQDIDHRPGALTAPRGIGNDTLRFGHLVRARLNAWYLGTEEFDRLPERSCWPPEATTARIGQEDRPASERPLWGGKLT